MIVVPHVNNAGEIKRLTINPDSIMLVGEGNGTSEVILRNGTVIKAECSIDAVNKVLTEAGYPVELVEGLDEIMAEGPKRLITLSSPTIIHQ